MAEFSIEKVTDNVGDGAKKALSLFKKKPMILAIGGVGLLGLWALSRRGSSQQEPEMTFASYPKPITDGGSSGGSAGGGTPSDTPTWSPYEPADWGAIPTYPPQTQILDVPLLPDTNGAESSSYANSLYLSNPTEENRLRAVAGLGYGGTTDAAKIQSNVFHVQTDASFRSSEMDRAKLVLANRKAEGKDTTYQEKYIRDLQTVERQSKSGYGNNGKGSKEDYAKNEAKLKNDKSFRESEKQRAKDVIENRRRAGLDTSLQEKYLARL